jgi:type I restriction enzyme, S subunit
MTTNVPAGYKQTEVGVIPSEWSVRPLLSTVHIANGQVDPKVEPYKSMTLVAPDHIEGKTGRLLEKRTASDQKAISGKYLFSAGDIVYSKIRPYLRKVILADFEGICSADMYPLKAAQDVVAGYVFPVLLGERFSAFAESVSLRSGMPKINRAEMSEFSIALPPYSEQRAIATAISDVDALLTKLDQLIAKKRDLKQATMQQLLTGQTRLPGFSGEWEVKRLGDICEIAMGRTPPRINPAMWGNGHVWLSIADLTGKVVSESKEQITDQAAALITAIPKGTLLMSFKLSIGRLCFAGCDLYTNEAICSFGKLQADAGYLYYALGRTDFSLYGKQAVKGYTLNKESLKLVEVQLPLRAEQIAIASVLSDMDAEIQALEARRDKTRALKQGMMQELLTGRIRLV